MTTREEVALRLDELAEDQRFVSRKEDLESLAAALRDQGDGSWTGVDLVGAFPPEASVTIRHRARSEKFFGIVAGASVFLPVAWTWFGLRSATNAYNDYLAAHTAEETAGQTFLALWTSGFEGRLENYHRFGPMALVSLILILAAAAAIVVHRLLAERNVAREDHQVNTAKRDLVVALVTAQRYLNERRTDDPRFLEEAIKRSIGELKKAQTATRKSVEEMGTAASRAVVELGESTRQFADDLNSVSNSVLRQLEPTIQATLETGTKLSESARATVLAQEQMAVSASKIQSGLSDALAQFDDSVGRSSEQTNSAVHSLTGSVDRVASAKDEWARALAEGLAANSRSVENISEQFRQFTRLLQDHQGTLQAQANDLRRAADLSGQMLEELRERAASNGTGR